MREEHSDLKWRRFDLDLESQLPGPVWVKSQQLTYLFSRLNFLIWDTCCQKVREEDVLLWKMAALISTRLTRLFIKVCVESLKPKFSNCGEVFSKKMTFCSCFMLLGCSSRTEFFMRLFNLEGSVGPVKETELKPHQCAFELSSDSVSALGRCVSMHVFVFPSSWACKRSVLNVCLCSVVLSRLPKFILQNGAGFSYPSVSQGARDKELTLGSRPPGSPMCVCLSQRLLLCVSLCLCCILPIDVWECRGARGGGKASL